MRRRLGEQQQSGLSWMKLAEDTQTGTVPSPPSCCRLGRNNEDTEVGGGRSDSETVGNEGFSPSSTDGGWDGGKRVWVRPQVLQRPQASFRSQSQQEEELPSAPPRFCFSSCSQLLLEVSVRSGWSSAGEGWMERWMETEEKGGQPGGKWEVTAPLVLPSVQLQVLLVQTASPDSRTTTTVAIATEVVHVSYYGL